MTHTRATDQGLQKPPCSKPRASLLMTPNWEVWWMH